MDVEERNFGMTDHQHKIVGRLIGFSFLFGLFAGSTFLDFPSIMVNAPMALLCASVAFRKEKEFVQSLNEEAPLSVITKKYSEEWCFLLGIHITYSLMGFSIPVAWHLYMENVSVLKISALLIPALILFFVANHCVYSLGKRVHLRALGES